MRDTVYEVRVRVKGGNGSSHYSSFLGMYIQEEETKMFHVDAKTSRKAMRKAEKHGKPISARKVDATSIMGNIENLQLDQPANPYENAIAMDEMIWKKRNKRISNKVKDKESIDISGE